MEQMIFSNMVNMIQFPVETRTESKQTVDDAEPGEFEKLLNKTAQEQESSEEISETPAEQEKPVTEAENKSPYVEENDNEKMELDIELLQELASVQIMVFKPENVKSVQPEVAEQEIIASPVQSTPVNVDQNVIVDEAVQYFEREETAIEPIVQAVPENTAIEQPETDVKNTQHYAVDPKSVEVTAEENNLEYEIRDDQVFGNVESVPIKVAEPELSNQEVQTVEDTKSVELQVSTKISEAVESGEMKIELQLEPENLGAVSIEITRSSEGAISIMLNAENKETQSLLKECSRSLETLLSNNGHQSVEVNVPRQEAPQEGEARYGDLPDDRGQGHNDRQQERRHNRTGTEDFLHQLRLGLIPLEEVS